MEISAGTTIELDSGKETEYLKKIEASLFISGRWLSIQELITLTDINPILLKQLLEKLTERYNHDASSINLLQKDNAWKLDVRAEYTYMINKLATGASEFTKAEQETLATLAYKQPVKQSVIIKIRGNKAYEHVKKFVQLGFLKAKRTGHTQELSLSEEFYDYFHVVKSKEEAEKTELEQVNPDENSQEAQQEIQ